MYIMLLNLVHKFKCEKKFNSFIHVIPHQPFDFLGPLSESFPLNSISTPVQVISVSVSDGSVNSLSSKLKPCKNKNLWYWFKATLTLETGIGYICDTHSYQREIFDGLEMKLI